MKYSNIEMVLLINTVFEVIIKTIDCGDNIKNILQKSNKIRRYNGTGATVRIKYRTIKYCINTV